MTRDTRSDSGLGPDSDAEPESRLDRYRPDDRAVSEILGAILLFGVLIAIIVLVQVTAVPAWNQQAEFEHNQRLQEDVGQLGDAIQRVRTGDAAESVAVELGVRYPPRIFLLNPPPATGRLETVDRGNISIRNAEAVDAETKDFWNGTRVVDYSTEGVVYTPNYNEYRNAPTTSYEQGVVFNRWEDNVTTIAQANQLLTGNDINLVALDGNLSRTDTDPTSVEVTPSSSAVRTVSMTGAGSGAQNIVISFQTTLSAESVQEVFGNETNLVTPPQYAPNGDGTATVTLTLDGSKTYDVRTSKVGVGDDPQPTRPRYLTVAESNTPGRYAVEVRDKYNQPKSGVNVSMAVGGTTTYVTTGSDGIASISYSGNGTITAEPVNDTLLNETPGYQDEEVVRITATSGGGGGDSGSGFINPIDTGVAVKETSAGITATFHNYQTSGSRQWKRLRVAFIGGNDNGIPEVVITGTAGAKTVYYSNQSGSISPFPVGGDYQTIYARTGDTGSVKLSPISFPAGGDVTLTFKKLNSQGKSESIQTNSFIVLSVEYEDGSHAQYFIGA